MSAMGRAEFHRKRDPGAPLFGEDAADTSTWRKSASHGEAGYARAAREAYFTEPWVTKALLAAFPKGHFGSPVWEPACGDGRMAEVLFDAGYCVCYSDIHDYGYAPAHFLKLDFLRDAAPDSKFEAVITNPPFDIAERFIVRALELTKPACGKVAMLQRHEFDAPRRGLFRAPFAMKLILPRRPEWPIWDEETRTAKIPLGKSGKREGPRFAYSWYLWDWRWQGEPVIRWIDEAP